MAQKTSWEGSLTKRLRKSGLRGFYTRYQNRRTKTGLEVVIPKATHLEVRTPSGQIKRLEPKYHNFSGNENSANRNYRKFIKNKFNKLKRRRR